jgi:hypothetical protein
LEFIILRAVPLLMLLGFALGLIALFGIRKHGIKGILMPAVIGLILNGLLIGEVSGPATLAALRRRHELQEKKRHVAATQFTEPAVAQDTSADSAALRAALVGKWVMDLEATAGVVARAPFGKRQQVIRLSAKAGQPQAYRTNITNKPFNAQEYERMKAECLAGMRSLTNVQSPSMTFAADGTGKSTNPNRVASARETAFQWQLDGHKVTLRVPADGRTNQFQFTNQPQITIPFWAERGLFEIFKREDAKSK